MPIIKNVHLISVQSSKHLSLFLVFLLIEKESGESLFKAIT